MRQNTPTQYGSVARAFHWAIALLILVELALGITGDNLPRSAEMIDTLKLIYSTHKTIGVVVLFLAIARILWALTQPRPVPLHPDRKLENFAAEVVHWSLYVAIILMPLSGWVMHSAETGFAPIFWPFGQDLPFVPKSEAVAHMAGAVHGLSAFVMMAVIAAHIGGALKHVVLDKDDTMARMAKGVSAGDATAHHGGMGKLLSLVAAAVLWIGVVLAAVTLGGAEEGDHAAPAATTEATTTAAADIAGPAWQVIDGALTFSVKQMGAAVEGQFQAWSATIAYDPDTGAGQVSVDIDMTSTVLGSVTDQVKGAEFFNVSSFATSRFEGEITRLEGASHQAVGTLDLVGQVAPVTLLFDLTLEGDSATMTGTTQLDRRDFGIGAAYGDETTVGFPVDVSVTLNAKRADG